MLNTATSERICANGVNGAIIPCGLKVPNPMALTPYHSGIPQAAFDLHRAQLYADYAARMSYGLRACHPGAAAGLAYHPQDAFVHPYLYGKDPRARFIHEEPKPSHSYIGLIAMAILSVKERKLVLSDIYQWILDNYAYFRARGPGWRNSIRHNLSLNDCFIKSGRSANGKGHYWAIHPANIEDFRKGDFRRRRAQRRVRKHMGLAVPDDEDSPTPPPTSSSPPSWECKDDSINVSDIKKSDSFDDPNSGALNLSRSATSAPAPSMPIKKRLFDVESLLAPDNIDKRLKSDEDAKKDNDDSEENNDISVDVTSIDGEGSPRLSEHNRSPSTASSPILSSRPSPIATNDELRSSWPSSSHTSVSAGPLFAWRDGPSAFHSTAPTAGLAWSTLASQGYPQLFASSAAYAGFPSASGSANSDSNAQKQWEEAFSKIMGRSYEKNIKVEI